MLFRAPPILHASQTNSDAAVVGLQAIHLLRGEVSPFLWGSGYQTSVDSAVAALWFSVLGPTARALLFSSLSLHLLLTALAWSVIARRTDPRRAAFAVLPLVFTSAPLQTYILYPPRQAALTLAVAALWAFDRAADRGRASAFALAAGVLGFACFADPYALVLVPPIAAFGVACAVDRSEVRASRARLAAAVAGGIAGMAPFFLLRTSGRATHGQLALGAGAVARSARFLLPCLRWTLGGDAWSASSAMSYGPWDGPLEARALVVMGGALFFVAIVAGAACVFARRLPWEVRRLAIAGGLALPVTVAGYLASPMVMDVLSSRYLVAIPLLAPFALAPLAAGLGTKRFAALVTPIAAAGAIAGWVGYGPFLVAAAEPSSESLLADALAARGVRYAAADYWASYRLTFLTGERLVVVPANAAEDRYPAYRAGFDAADRVAYVFDPERSREPASWIDARVAPHAQLERLRAGRFTAVVVARRDW